MPPHFLDDGNYIIAQKSPNFSVWEIRACAVELSCLLHIYITQKWVGLQGGSKFLSKNQMTKIGA